KKEGVLSVTCALRRGGSRIAQTGEIHAARCALSSVLHARCAGCWTHCASTKSI
ncbi:hypothetical protein A2U01_0059379, partial [Trifolium medium]|nr:hypothetical protein [Trifolium medium]